MSKAVIHDTLSLSGDYLYQVWKGSLQWNNFVVQYAKIFSDDPEGMGQGQKELYVTHLLLMVNNCIKY